MFKKLTKTHKFIIFSSTALALVLALVLIITPAVTAQQVIDFKDTFDDKTAQQSIDVKSTFYDKTAQQSIEYEGSFDIKGQTERRVVFLRIDDIERDQGTPRFFIASVTGKPIVPYFRVVVLDWKIRYVIDNDSDGRYEIVVNNIGGNDLNVKYKIRELVF